MFSGHFCKSSSHMLPSIFDKTFFHVTSLPNHIFPNIRQNRLSLPLLQVAPASPTQSFSPFLWFSVKFLLKTSNIPSNFSWLKMLQILHFARLDQCSGSLFLIGQPNLTPSASRTCSIFIEVSKRPIRNSVTSFPGWRRHFEVTQT